MQIPENCGHGANFDFFWAHSLGETYSFDTALSFLECSNDHVSLKVTECLKNHLDKAWTFPRTYKAKQLL